MKLSKLFQSCVQNRYMVIYDNLVARAKNEGRIKGSGVYYELHHIIPKSIAPEFANLRKHPWNGVLLTAKEHFLAHRLLCKFTTGATRLTCLRAYHAVCFKTRRCVKQRPTSLQYRVAREAISVANNRPRGIRGVPAWSGCQSLSEFKTMITDLVKQGLSDQAIATRFEISSRAVNNWRKKLNITNRRSKLRDETWLKEQYVTMKRTAQDIAEEIGCTATAVQQYLNRFNITMRKGNTKYSDSLLYNKEWLAYQYMTKKRSFTDIAEELGCSRPTVRNTLKRFGFIPEWHSAR